MFLLKAGDLSLPGPTSMTIDDEIIWSESTGRTLDGTMVGEAIAEKKTIGIKWSWITEEEVKTIKNSMILGFFPITFRDDGEDVTITTYRGTLSKDCAGDIGDGKVWYKSVSVDVVQR
ncbi:MAG: hypothetical protein SOT28_01610 [Fusicatenibacter sp.]|nr:hypothetical protein [Lachnospiraceae bacterium]MDY2937004.1 hypothetical protein [Fusicatenibacter sp.]